MISAKSYTEVNAVIKLMPEDLKSKIPEDLIKTIELNMDKEYDPNITDFNDIAISEEAEKVLSVLYTDYFATEEEKEVILQKEKLKNEQKEAEKRKIYNTDVFENNKISKESNANELVKTEKMNLFNKIWNKIKNIFSLLKK